MNIQEIMARFAIPAILCLAALGCAYYFYCLSALRRLSSLGLEETADFIFGPGLGLVGALQLRGEILPFLRQTFGSPPKVVAEIGRAKGGTLAMLCRAASPEALVISLDLPGSRHSGPLPLFNKGGWRLPLLRAMKGPRQDLRLIDGDSRSPASAEIFSKALDGKKLDLLFIDGDHTFEGVRSDFEMYSGFVRPGGVIAFHDIQPGYELELGVAVSRFWKEYPLPGKRAEFIADSSQLSYGIGALRLPG
ncbi:MAG: class I SAM-dependent methyltransferase [Elusimicrobiota bacterium]|nr:class I SAM-dependent methyltransferase [Elusimicrobiota bacterium]